MWQPGGLGVLRRVAEGVAEKARTRSFASLTLVRFAFVVVIYVKHFRADGFEEP